MAVGSIDGVVALAELSYKEMYGRFVGTKKCPKKRGEHINDRKEGSTCVFHFKPLCFKTE